MNRLVKVISTSEDRTAAAFELPEEGNLYYVRKIPIFSNLFPKISDRRGETMKVSN